MVPRNQVNVRGWVPSDSSTVVSSADEGDKGKETEKQQGAMPGLAVERVYMTCSNGGTRVGTGTCTGAGGGAGAGSAHETLDVYILGTNAQLFIAPIAWNLAINVTTVHPPMNTAVPMLQDERLSSATNSTR